MKIKTEGIYLISRPSNMWKKPIRSDRVTPAKSFPLFVLVSVCAAVPALWPLTVDGDDSFEGRLFFHYFIVNTAHSCQRRTTIHGPISKIFECEQMLLQL